MERKIILAVGCILGYVILAILTNGASHIFLVLGLLGYGMYKFG